MYHRGSAVAFTGFAVAGDASGLFRQLGLVGPVLSVLHVMVGALLGLWLLAFLFALTLVTLRRLGRGVPAVLPSTSSVSTLARRSAS